jgi:hypothetical protein
MRGCVQCLGAALYAEILSDRAGGESWTAARGHLRKRCFAQVKRLR